MQVYAVSIAPEELQKSKASELKCFPIPMPKQDLEKLTEFCRERGWNRCEWARKVLLASFGQMTSTESLTTPNP